MGHGFCRDRTERAGYKFELAIQIGGHAVDRADEGTRSTADHPITDSVARSRAPGLQAFDLVAAPAAIPQVQRPEDEHQNATQRRDVAERHPATVSCPPAQGSPGRWTRRTPTRRRRLLLAERWRRRVREACPKSREVRDDAVGGQNGCLHVRIVIAAHSLGYRIAPHEIDCGLNRESDRGHNDQRSNPWRGGDQANRGHPDRAHQPQAQWRRCCGTRSADHRPASSARSSRRRRAKTVAAAQGTAADRPGIAEPRQAQPRQNHGARQQDPGRRQARSTTAPAR